MSMILVNVLDADVEKDIFQEGNLVQSTQTGSVMLVTCVAQGYENDGKDHFWGINLSTGRSEGGYLKSLFKQFVGTVTLEGKY